MLRANINMRNTTRYPFPGSTVIDALYSYHLLLTIIYNYSMPVCSYPQVQSVDCKKNQNCTGKLLFLFLLY